MRLKQAQEKEVAEAKQAQESTEEKAATEGVDEVLVRLSSVSCSRTDQL